MILDTPPVLTQAPNFWGVTPLAQRSLTMLAPGAPLEAQGAVIQPNGMRVGPSDIQNTPTFTTGTPFTGDPQDAVNAGGAMARTLPPSARLMRFATYGNSPLNQAADVVSQAGGLVSKSTSPDGSDTGGQSRSYFYDVATPDASQPSQILPVWGAVGLALLAAYLLR